MTRALVAQGDAYLNTCFTYLTGTPGSSASGGSTHTTSIPVCDVKRNTAFFMCYTVATNTLLPPPCMDDAYRTQYGSCRICVCPGLCAARISPLPVTVDYFAYSHYTRTFIRERKNRTGSRLPDIYMVATAPPDLPAAIVLQTITGT